MFLYNDTIPDAMANDVLMNINTGCTSINEISAHKPDIME